MSRNLKTLAWPALPGLVLLAWAGEVGAQATNPAYLAELPPVERILREITGTTPDETAARQMGTFLQFKGMIESMAGDRRYANKLTPDETRLIQVYYTAWWEIAKTKPEYQKFTGLKGYDISPDWRNELFAKYFSPQFKAVYDGVNAEYDRRIAARAKAGTQNMLRARAEAEEYQKTSSGKGKDVRGLARCVASGRSETQCLSEGLVNGFNDLVGGAMPILKKAPIFGIRMSGVYSGSGIGLTFWNEHAVIACGELVLDERAYTVEVRNNQLLISVKTTPKTFELVQGPSKAFTLTLGADGRLTGPGPTDITGRIITGYEQWTREWSDGRKEPYTKPVYSNTTLKCNFIALALAGVAPSFGRVSTGLAVGLNLLLGGGQDKEAGKPAPPGVRINGEYGSQSVTALEFQPEGVVVGCGDAVVAREYSVAMVGGQPVVKVQHGTTPFSVTLQSNGTLSGSGSLVVSGRVITGTDANGNLTFASRTGTCQLGVLAPAGQPQPSQPAAISGGMASASTITAAATPGNAVLAVELGGTNAAGASLGGRGFFLYKGTAEQTLAAAGFKVAPGTSAASVLAAACKTESAECRQGLLAMMSKAIGVLTTDGGGKGQFPGVAPGTYSLFGAAVTGDKPRLWILTIELKGGSNALVLDQRNAAPL